MRAGFPTSTPGRLAGFALLLALLFGGGALAGGAIGPDRAAPRGTHAEPAGAMEHGEHGGMAAMPVRGLAVAENGLRLIVASPELRRGRTEDVRFRIVSDDGATVRDFDVTHTKRLHLIVVRRDMTGFQHLHPRQGADGAWSVPVRLGDPGSYRLFADFSHKGELTTLAADLRVDGSAELAPLPAPAPTAQSDGGYVVRLEAGRARPGREAELNFTITRDGQKVQTEPYLGAGGHLVALREGDLAFLHVHPKDGGIGFAATFPTAGQYRLFLQFQHEGRVQTVAFTQEVK